MPTITIFKYILRLNIFQSTFSFILYELSKYLFLCFIFKRKFWIFLFRIFLIVKYIFSASFILVILAYPEDAWNSVALEFPFLYGILNKNYSKSVCCHLAHQSKQEKKLTKFFMYFAHKALFFKKYIQIFAAQEEICLMHDSLRVQ